MSIVLKKYLLIETYCDINMKKISEAERSKRLEFFRFCLENKDVSTSWILLNGLLMMNVLCRKHAYGSNCIIYYP